MVNPHVVDTKKIPRLNRTMHLMEWPSMSLSANTRMRRLLDSDVDVSTEG